MASDGTAGLLADPFPGINPNRPVRDPDSWRDVRAYYDLLFVEFDDQGRPFEADAIDRVMAHLRALSQSSDVIVMLFVHGWKHSARDGDDNVESVHRILHTAGHTEEVRPSGQGPRRVVGVYVGWRGLSLHWAGLLENATFWGRKEAALRVALGSVRELFARLRQFRIAAGVDKKDGTRLIIAGHSFGGLIVHAAIAEYLVESVVAADDTTARILPFGDMTILVNPAFEASRYYPLHAIVARRRFAPLQPPVFISVTGENDWATSFAFPAGRHLTLWTGASVDRRERETNFDTMGHVLWMQTHALTKRPSAEHANVKLIEKKKLDTVQRSARINQEDVDFEEFLKRETGLGGGLLPGWTRSYTAGAQLTHISPPPEAGGVPMSPDNPFWVVRASADIINGHNGIFGFVFLDFLRQVLDDVVRMERASGKR